MESMKLTRPANRSFGRTFVAVLAAVSIAGATVLSAVHAVPAHAATSITMWSGISGADQTAFKSIVDSFNSSQNDVQVNYQQQDFTHYGDKLTVAISGGKAPNVWTGDNQMSTNYASLGVLAQLDDAVKGSSVINTKNFDKLYWNAGMYNGHLYAVPLDMVPLVMYYNKALYKKAHLKFPPFTSQKSFLAAVKKLRHGDQYGLIVPPDWPAQFWFPTFLAQFGGKMFDTSGKKAAFNSPAGAKALKFMYDLIFKYKVSPPNTAQDQDIKMLANKSVATIMDGPWMYTSPTVQTLKKDLGIAPVPQVGSKKAVFVGTLYFMSYAKNSSDENKAVVKWLEYFQAHSIKMADAGPVPAYKPVLNSAAFKKLPAGKVVASELKYGFLPVSYPHYADGWLYSDAVFPVLRGRVSAGSIKSVLDKAAKKVTQHVNGS
jgi:multiple sugar transport system substrate-binding protein